MEKIRGSQDKINEHINNDWKTLCACAPFNHSLICTVCCSFCAFTLWLDCTDLRQCSFPKVNIGTSGPQKTRALAEYIFQDLFVVVVVHVKGNKMKITDNFVGEKNNEQM